MYRLNAQHAAYTVLAHLDRSAESHAGVNAADLGEAQESFGGDAGDDEADLIHVSVEHHLMICGLFALLKDYQVAEGVDMIFGVTLDLADNIFSDCVLTPGYPGDGAKLFDKLKHRLSLPRRYIPP